MISARHVLGWVLSTTLVTLAAWWVVAAASGEVNETAGAPLVVPATSSPLDPGSSTLPDSPTTTMPGSTITSRAATSTTALGAGTSITTPAMPSGVETVGSAGGTVTVSYGNGQVHLQGASPAFGYSMTIEKTGPDEVRVDFESDGSDVSVRVKWEGGLDVEIKS